MRAAKATYKSIEAHKDKTFRISWVCPCCSTTYYDFFGVNGKKLKAGQRFSVSCENCLKVWEEKREAHYKLHGYFTYQGLSFPTPEPVSFYISPESR